MKVKLETKKQKRAKRTRSKITGTSSVPRVSVFRSLKNIYAQAIDDEKGHTLASTDIIKRKKGVTKVEIANEIGKSFGEKLKKLKIEKIVFDKGSFKYHGRVKSLADGIRSAGIKF